MAQIFISYSHADSDYVQKLVKALEKRGFQTWYDERIDYGDRWFQAIGKAIRHSAAVIVVMTPTAEESEWVEREILIAQRNNKPIFPLLLKGDVLDLLITTQYADVQGSIMPPDDFYDRINSQISPKPKPNFKPPTPSKSLPVSKPKPALQNPSLEPPGLTISMTDEISALAELTNAMRQTLFAHNYYRLGAVIFSNQLVVSILPPRYSDPRLGDFATPPDLKPYTTQFKPQKKPLLNPLNLNPIPSEQENKFFPNAVIVKLRDNFPTMLDDALEDLLAAGWSHYPPPGLRPLESVRFPYSKLNQETISRDYGIEWPPPYSIIDWQLIRQWPELSLSVYKDILEANKIVVRHLDKSHFFDLPSRFIDASKSEFRVVKMNTLL